MFHLQHVKYDLVIMTDIVSSCLILFQTLETFKFASEVARFHISIKAAIEKRTFG